MSNLNLTALRASLFLSTDGQPYTTSRAVAEHFGKKHYNVLRDIENLRKDIADHAYRELNFEATFYPVAGPKGAVRQEPEYRLTHDGFALLAMGFTGKEALAWKVAFLQAFNEMEAELLQRELRYSHALDQVRPALRPVTEGTEIGESRAVIASRLGKSVSSVTYHRAKARQLGLLN